MATSDYGDAIRIEELELFLHVGVPEEEREKPQRLTLSLTIFPRCGFPGLGDDIANAVDYASVCREVRTFAGRRGDRLIETLADAIASHLMETFPLRRVELELRKFILPEVRYVAVILSRDRVRET